MWGILGVLIFKSKNMTILSLKMIIILFFYYCMMFEGVKYMLAKYMFFDMYSFYLMFLCFFILLCVSFQNLNYYQNLLGKILIFMLMMIFMMKNYMGLFIFLELSVMPMITIILVWGLTPERMKASVFMFNYGVK